MNHHPLAMFEIIAADQEQLLTFYQQLFGWKVQRDSAGYAYIHYPPPPPGGYRIMGGIGQQKPGVPGYGKGTAFYVQVESVEHALHRAVELGGSKVVTTTHVDGYTFGMFNDPEGNQIGVIEPFKD